MWESMAVGKFGQQWNKGVLLLCVIALAMDPLFLYIPEVDLTKKCVGLDEGMRVAACIIRSILDALYLFHIIARKRKLYDIDNDISTTELVLDTSSILPVPQIMLWIAASNGSTAHGIKEALKFVIVVQAIPRCIRIYPLFKQVKSTSGFIAQNAWVAAAINLFLYVLVGHAVGALWYIVSVERQETCWHDTCDKYKNIGRRIKNCYTYLYNCETKRTSLFVKSLNASCTLTNPDDITNPTKEFDFGIFFDALRSRIVYSKFSKSFGKKLFYCSWWGMRNLSSIGQNLKTSTFIPEVVFAYGISIVGLVLFALLIGNMNTFLQSMSRREEKMRVRKGDEYQWMKQRDLPDDIKKKVEKYEESKWQLTKEVDEEDLIKTLPMGLRREIHRHLWHNTFILPLHKIPIIKEMSQHFIDEMFDRMKLVVFPEKTTIITEDEAVYEILFITKGSMMTSDKAGFYFTSMLKKGDLCGEEILTWACDPNRTSDYNLPISTRQVVTESQVEAYALAAEDFKSIASKFQSSIDKKQLDKAIKYHSSEYRTRGASAIWKAWERYKEKKQEKALSQAEQTIPRH